MNYFKGFGILVLTFGIMGIETESKANLIINGSFEEPAFLGDWTQFASIPGWQWDENYPIDILRTLNDFKGWLPYDGAQYIESTSIQDMYQSVPTVAGYHYVLSYAYSPRPSTPLSPVVDNPLDVYWDGELVSSHNTLSIGVTHNQWTVFSFEVVASSSSTLVQFKSQLLGVGTFLDDVRLVETETQPVPEPSTFVALGSLIFVGIAARRFVRRKI